MSARAVSAWNVDTRLARVSATTLFAGAGVVTIANALLVTKIDRARVDVPTLLAAGVVCMLSAGAVQALARRRFSRRARIGVAIWGLTMLMWAAVAGRYGALEQARIVFPAFLMVVLVWLGLVGGRGLPALVAPIAAGCAVYASHVPRDSTIRSFDALMVIAVSILVAETIAWVMQELHERGALLAMQTMTDPLTGLLNRSALRLCLEDLHAAHQHVMLAFVDLNDFKHINDSFGHEVGDEVLIEVARRLRSVVRDRDVVARFGGDEFVIVAPDPGDELDARKFVESIKTSLDASWPQLNGAGVTGSVGVVSDRDAALAPEDLLRSADTAMYARKHGVLARESHDTMPSMSLRHYRAAIDGMGGGFAVLRAQRDGAVIVDWQIIEANAVLRDRYREVFEDPLGVRLSELDRYGDNSSLRDVYEVALRTGEPQEREILLQLPPGVELHRRLVAVPLEPDVVAAMTFPITTPAPLEPYGSSDMSDASRSGS